MEFTTERLVVRTVSVEDADAMYQYRSDPDTSQYLTTIPRSADDIAEMISKSSVVMDVPGSWYQFVLVESTNNTLIGDIGVHFLETDPENTQVEIGYTLDKMYRGKGYATEALRVIIDYLFNTLKKRRIIASIDPSNSASIRLVERLGFRKEAHFVESLFFHGKWVDDLIYAILAKEWRQKYANNTRLQA